MVHRCELQLDLADDGSGDDTSDDAYDGTNADDRANVDADDGANVDADDHAVTCDHDRDDACRIASRPRVCFHSFIGTEDEPQVLASRLRI